MASSSPDSRSSEGASGVAGVLKFFNREFTIFRGTTVNEVGDETDVGVPLYRHVQAAVAETGSETFDRSSSTRRTIRTSILKFPGHVDVTTDDTLQDEATGLFYMVESMESEPGIGYYPPFKILTLRSRSGISVQSDG